MLIFKKKITLNDAVLKRHNLPLAFGEIL